MIYIFLAQPTSKLQAQALLDWFKTKPGAVGPTYTGFNKENNRVVTDQEGNVIITIDGVWNGREIDDSLQLSDPCVALIVGLRFAYVPCGTYNFICQQ